MPRILARELSRSDDKERRRLGGECSSQHVEAEQPPSAACRGRTCADDPLCGQGDFAVETVTRPRDLCLELLHATHAGADTKLP